MRRLSVSHQERMLVHRDWVAGKIGIHLGWMAFTARRMRRAALPGGRTCGWLADGVWGCEAGLPQHPGSLCPLPQKAGTGRGTLAYVTEAPLLHF